MSETEHDALERLLRPVLYAERTVRRDGTIDYWARRMVAEAVPLFAERRARRLAELVPLVHAATADLVDRDDEGLRERARTIAERLRRSDDLAREDVAVAFAVVREASGRVLGLRHHDVQLMGGHALLSGMVAEMSTGEGKTLTAALAAVTGALAGRPTHVVTVNDYLAQRDAEKLGPLYRFFDLSVGSVVSGMEPAERRAAYACDVTYCTNKELAFDYLKDRLLLTGAGGNLRRKVRLGGREAGDGGGLLLRGLHYAIVDEADSVLIDEARTPLILSGEENGVGNLEMMRLALVIADGLVEGRDWNRFGSEVRFELTAAGEMRIDGQTRGHDPAWGNRILREELLVKALTAIHGMKREEHYILKDDKVAIVDEYTGRLMEDRFWSEGLHQMVELKEGLTPSARRATLARLTYQRFFRRYRHLGGMTGTAAEVASELWEVYDLPVARIPTHRPSRRVLVPDAIFPTSADRWAAVVRIVEKLTRRGSPVLIGTRSVAASLEASRHLRDAGITHRVLNAVDEAAEAEIVAEAGERGRVTVATNMAGRGTDIALGEGVEAVGGLHVVMTERHDAARIDRQLAGRSARQGDPGFFVALLSLDDAVITKPSKRLVRAIAAFAVARGFPGVARFAMRHAQKAAEREHASIRRALQRSDEGLDHALAFTGTPD